MRLTSDTIEMTKVRFADDTEPLTNGDAVDADISDDADDEDDIYVADNFIEESSKPLMPPRLRTKTQHTPARYRCQRNVRIICLWILASLMVTLTVLLVKYVKKSGGGVATVVNGSDSVVVVPCSHVQVKQVWRIGIPKLDTESAIRMVDVNGDDVLDVVLAFGTGADGYYIPDFVCDIYFNGTVPCLGGVMARDGATGDELWRHYTQHEMYALNCNNDLDGDGVLDCVAGGRAGVMEAVSGASGMKLWAFVDKEAKVETMNTYTAQTVGDEDGDGVVDFVQIHGGDPLQKPGSDTRLEGRLMVVSGRTGRILRWMVVPDRRESYYSPQMYLKADATQMILFGTGGETHGGGLWVIPLRDLHLGRIDKATRLLSAPNKGYMTPPALADITGDGVEDIIIPSFAGTVTAVNGQTYDIIWERTFPQSESYSTPAVGFYNDDDVPDFMVMYGHGPGYPVYYYGITTILDGRNGHLLIDPVIKNQIAAQASPLAVSMEGRGNDLFLFWTADCTGYEGSYGKFNFVNGTNVHEKSRANFCRLRFKTSGYSLYKVLGANIKLPGSDIYNSGTDDIKNFENSAWVNTTAEGVAYVARHPDHMKDYLMHSANTAEDGASGKTDNSRRRPDLNKSQKPTDYTDWDHKYEQPYDLNQYGPYQPDGQYERVSQYPPQNPQSQYPPQSPHSQYPPPNQPPQYPQNYPQYPPKQYPRNYQYGQNQYRRRSGDGQRFPTSGGYVPSKRSLDDYDKNSARLKRSVLDEFDFDLSGDDLKELGRVINKRDNLVVDMESLLSREKERKHELGILHKNKNVVRFNTRFTHVSPSIWEDIQQSNRDSNDNIRKYHRKIHDKQNRNVESKFTYQKKHDLDDKLQRKYHDTNIHGILSHHINQANEHLHHSIHTHDILKPYIKQQNLHTRTKHHINQQNQPTLGLNTHKIINRHIHKQTHKNLHHNIHTRNKRHINQENLHKIHTRNKRHINQQNIYHKIHTHNKRDINKQNLPKHPQKWRRRRHVGPHDEGGLQRLLSTGTLAPTSLPTTHPHYNHSTDLIFATYWFFPAHTKLTVENVKKCLADKLDNAKRHKDDKRYEFYGLTGQTLKDKLQIQCESAEESEEDHMGTFESQGAYNPYNIHMGQMSLYRVTLICSCGADFVDTESQRCAKMLPYDQQRWRAYMGSMGDCHWMKP